MKSKAKLLIFILVVLAVGVIFVLPYYNPVEKESEDNKSEVRFVVTSQPAQKLKEAQSTGKPVFLEFYAVT